MHKSTNKKTKQINSVLRRRLKKVVPFLILILFFGYISNSIIIRIVTNHLLLNSSIHIKAIIIDDQNYLGNNPVKPIFSYSYKFTINGKEYTNDSHDINLKIGDSVEVEYVKDWPIFNRPIHKRE